MATSTAAVTTSVSGTDAFGAAIGKVLTDPGVVNAIGGLAGSVVNTFTGGGQPTAEQQAAAAAAAKAQADAERTQLLMIGGGVVVVVIVVGVIIYRRGKK